MAQVVEITEAAAFHVKEMMRHNEEEGSFLRVAVNGGGCSGLTYGMGFEAEKSAEDLLLEQHGLQILVFERRCRDSRRTKLIIKSPSWGADLR